MTDDNTDGVEPVTVTATLPKDIVDALEQAHDSVVENRKESLSARGFSTEAVGSTDQSAGAKIVRLAIQAHNGRRPVRRALSQYRQDEG